MSPTRLQHSTRQLKPWPRQLRAVTIWEPGLLDFYHLGLVLRCQRARLLFVIFNPACEGLNKGSPSKIVCFGLDTGRLPVSIQPPSAAAVISNPGRRPAGSTAHEAVPALTSVAARTSPLVLGPLRSYRLRLEMWLKRARMLLLIFSAPRSEDGIL